jgi:multiple sugar transport system substrate-binding protein
MNLIAGISIGALLLLAPLGARAADLVVWWDEPYYAEEGEALKEIIAAFEQESGKQVELVSYPQEELADKIAATFEAGQPPDFAFGILIDNNMSKWAFDDRLVDLTDAIDHFADLFDPDALTRWMLLNQKTGEKALYGLPMGQNANYVHVWKSLLEQAGFTLGDIPKQWDAFWAFWCDEVPPAVRRAMGRDDLWGVGLSMSGETSDTLDQFFQFLAAYDADYVTPDGRLVIDDPEVRRRLIVAIDAHTAVYREGCTPPDVVNWSAGDRNNKAFLAQTGGHDSEPDALDSQRAQGRASRRLLREHRHHRMAARPRRRGFSDQGRLRGCSGLQGRRPRRHCQGVRALSRGGGLACPLPQLLRRAHDAADAEAA